MVRNLPLILLCACGNPDGWELLDTWTGFGWPAECGPRDLRAAVVPWEDATEWSDAVGEPQPGTTLVSLNHQWCDPADARRIVVDRVRGRHLSVALEGPIPELSIDTSFTVLGRIDGEWDEVRTGLRLRNPD